MILKSGILLKQWPSCKRWPMSAVANNAAFIGTFRMCSNVHYVSLINVRHQSSRDRSVPKSPISIAVWTGTNNIIYNNMQEILSSGITENCPCENIHPGLRSRENSGRSVVEVSQVGPGSIKNQSQIGACSLILIHVAEEGNVQFVL